MLSDGSRDYIIFMHLPPLKCLYVEQHTELLPTHNKNFRHISPIFVCLNDLFREMVLDERNTIHVHMSCVIWPYVARSKVQARPSTNSLQISAFQTYRSMVTYLNTPIIEDFEKVNIRQRLQMKNIKYYGKAMRRRHVMLCTSSFLTSRNCVIYCNCVFDEWPVIHATWLAVGVWWWCTKACVVSVCCAAKLS